MHEFALKSLLLERFGLFLKVYSHPAKIAASTMLGKALQTASKSKRRRALSESMIEQLGDVALLAYLAASSRTECRLLTERLLRRNLYKPVFRARCVGNPPEMSVRRAYETLLDKYRGLGMYTPDGREEIEVKIARKCGIDPAKLAVYCPDRAPGFRKVRQYIEYERGRPRVVDEAAFPHRRILDRHIGLWFMYVFADPEIDSHTKHKIQREAEEYFGLTNELDADRRQGMLF